MNLSLNRILGKVRGFFRPRSDLFLFGSSILWGQGHEEGEKIGPNVAKWIEERFREEVRVFQMAHSGAFLNGDPVDGAPRLHGEVPSPWPSVLEQIRVSPSPKIRRVRILIEGGINEVGGGKISSPTTSLEYIESATKAACYEKLKSVLQVVSRRFPRAEIYVIGYYQILANRAGKLEVEGMLKEEVDAPERAEEREPDFADRSIGNSRRFWEQSDYWLKLAAEETAASHPGVCKFVPSGFDGEEGMFGERPLVFSPWTRDPMRGERAKHCTVAIARGQTGFHCYLAATAHPNAEGLSRYVSSITAAMEANAVR